MTSQEAFNRVWRHFITEAQPPSVSVHGDCFYQRGSRQCAVGVLIPDEHYYPDMEKSELRELLDLLADVLPRDTGFVINLQVAHDRAAKQSFHPFHQEVRRELTSLAKRYRLEVPND